MTKKKHKFTLQSSFINSHGSIITFDRIAKDGELISIFKVCDLLNKLYEENEELKKDKDNLLHQLSNVYDYFRKCFDNVSDEDFKETWDIVRHYGDEE